MNDAVVLEHATKRAKSLLKTLSDAGLAGNVVVQFHRDSSRVKKVVVTYEESWIVPAEKAEITA